MASVRLRDRDLTAGLRSRKLKGWNEIIQRPCSISPRARRWRASLVRSAGLGFKDTRAALVIVFENLEDLMTIDEVLRVSWKDGRHCARRERYFIRRSLQ